MKHGRCAGLKKLSVSMILCLLLLAGCVSGLVHIGLTWLLLLFVSLMVGLQKLVRACILADNMGWLARMPWTHEKPLPFGAPFLEKRDVLRLGVIASTALFLWWRYLSSVPDALEGTFLECCPVFLFYPVAPMIVYFASCILVMLVLLAAFRQGSYWVGVISGLPLVVYPFRDLVFACAVLVVICVYCHIGVKRYLKGFPWNSTYWNGDSAKEVREKTQEIAIKPPSSNRYLNPKMDFKEISLFSAVWVSGLTLWLGHVVSWLIGWQMEYSSMCFVAIILAIMRVVSYWEAGIGGPPISYIGRICTGRWIIPGYDKVFIAPVCVVLAGVLGPVVLEAMMLPAWLAMRMTFFVVFLLALSLPPSRQTWYLTGAHRLVVSRERMQSVNRREGLEARNMARELRSRRGVASWFSFD